MKSKHVPTFKWLMLPLLLVVVVALVMAQENEKVPPEFHSRTGEKAQSSDGEITLTISERKVNYTGCNKLSRDTDIWSPKSVHFHPGGKKYYINSLEGCITVVYDAVTNKKLKVIKHFFNAKNVNLFAHPSGLFSFTHYQKNLNTFVGRPVESTFSHKGRYLWIPYYRRSYDLNAQDPSAIAIIDTRDDSIIKVMETGPLPKMVATSHNGKYLAVTHWGNNTVGIIDISSPNPARWHYVKCIVVDNQLPMDFSMTEKIDRDTHSGYMLRGTVFTPDDHYLLVGCMGGSGGIATIDMNGLKYMGRLTGIYNARHLLINNGYLYASLNVAGVVQRLPLEKVFKAIKNLKGKTAPLHGWKVCQVGKGARTIANSPSGKYVFVASNAANKVCVIDTRSMKMIASLSVDSYPVGLDLSPDGKRLVVTSQGRKGHGGNAVNIIDVTYKTPESAIKSSQDTNIIDKAKMRLEETFKMPWSQLLTMLIGIALVMGIVGIRVFSNKHKRKRNG